MQITIPAELEEPLRSRAQAAGFGTVDEYVVHLLSTIRPQEGIVQDALRELRQLREEVPRMSDSEIVELVSEGRDRCP